MFPIFAAAFTDNELLVMGAGALFVTVAIARAWAADAGRWGKVITGLRSENHALRVQADSLLRRVAELTGQLRAEREKHPPGIPPGAAAGGPGPTS